MATVKGSVEMWQHAAVTLTTCVIAMAGFWLMEGKEYATRTEISLMIRKESPYTVDRALIMQQMSDSTAINKWSCGKNCWSLYRCGFNR